MRSVSLATAGFLLGLAARGLFAQATPVPRTALPHPAPPQKPVLSEEDKAQARKTLAAAVAKREGTQPPPSPAAGFQAHRCAVLYDPRIFGKERTANGPFRTTCSDWVARHSRELSMKDAAQPCAEAQYSTSLVGCSTWVDHWDSGSSKWVNSWRQSTF